MTASLRDVFDIGPDFVGMTASLKDVFDIGPDFVGMTALLYKSKTPTA